MSFKTMDGVEVYTKNDTDALLETERGRTSAAEQNITNLQTSVQSLDNSKATKGELQNVEQQISLHETRLHAVENTQGVDTNRIHDLETNSATKAELNTGLNLKADKTYAQQTRQIANNNAEAITALQNRAANIEAVKLDKADLPAEVNRQVDNIITAKVQSIVSDINHIVDNAIDDELEDYDDKAGVNQKIASAVAGLASEQYVDQAIAAIPNPGVASTADVQAIVNQYF